MAKSDYTEGADIELAQLATALIDEHNQQAKADLVAKIVRVATRAAKDSLPQPDDGKISTDTGINFNGFDSDLYCIKEGASKVEVHDQLSSRLLQLEAMLIVTYGAGAESFHDYNDTIKDNYLWACASLAKECNALVHMI